jgi:hypothetical protein
MPRRDPGRAEDRDAVLDVAQRVEAPVDLGADAVEPKLVLFLLDVAGLAQQLLVADRGRNAPGGIRTRAARLKRPPL